MSAPKRRPSTTGPRLKKTPFRSQAFPRQRSWHAYYLDCIPIDLWRKVVRKARQKQVSLRSVLLHYLVAWSSDPML